MPLDPVPYPVGEVQCRAGYAVGGVEPPHPAVPPPVLVFGVPLLLGAAPRAAVALVDPVPPLPMYLLVAVVRPPAVHLVVVHGHVVPPGAHVGAHEAVVVRSRRAEAVAVPSGGLGVVHSPRRLGVGHGEETPGGGAPGDPALVPGVEAPRQPVGPDVHAPLGGAGAGVGVQTAPSRPLVRRGEGRRVDLLVVVARATELEHLELTPGHRRADHGVAVPDGSAGTSPGTTDGRSHVVGYAGGGERVVGVRVGRGGHGPVETSSAPGGSTGKTAPPRRTGVAHRLGPGGQVRREGVGRRRSPPAAVDVAPAAAVGVPSPPSVALRGRARGVLAVLALAPVVVIFQQRGQVARLLDQIRVERALDIL